MTVRPLYSQLVLSFSPGPRKALEFSSSCPPVSFATTYTLQYSFQNQLEVFLSTKMRFSHKKDMIQSLGSLLEYKLAPGARP